MSDNFEPNKNSNMFTKNNETMFGQQKTSSFQANTSPFGNTDTLPTNNSGLSSRENNVDNKDIILDIPVNVQIVLGSTSMPVATLMNLKRGEIINLDASLGDPVQIVVNGRTIAKGELVPIENDSSHFGVSVIEILNKK